MTDLSHIQTPEGFNADDGNEMTHAPAPSETPFSLPAGAVVIDLTVPENEATDDIQVVEAQVVPDGPIDDDVIEIPADHVSVLRQGGA